MGRVLRLDVIVPIDQIAIVLWSMNPRSAKILLMGITIDVQTVLCDNVLAMEALTAVVLRSTQDNHAVEQVT